MRARETAMAILRLVPMSWRRALKDVYEGLPSYGRRQYYGEFGEDAFLQHYFRLKLDYARTDMMLSQFLRRACEPGFYVDVGAHHPKRISSTRWFYQHGWHGINIDAAPGSMEAFRRARPRDVNLELLISDGDAVMEFLQWPTASGLNTVTPRNALFSTQAVGQEPVRTFIKSRSLDAVLSEYVPTGANIDFMTIDVEGHEIHALRSNDWDRFRPELVLVENHGFDVALPNNSSVYGFMTSVGYELYAWLRPTLVFRQTGLYDYLSPPEYSAQSD